MSKNTTSSAPADAPKKADVAEARPSKYDWADPSVPAGNAPPMPRWPLVVSAVVFALWVCFLIAMAIVRVCTTSV